MAYNKTKILESAQKYLNQGRTAQAIAEYQTILRQEPKDQVTLMTIGDLFVRQGETFQALDYFERLAQLYLAEGFVTKAIAIYKKIAKLAPEETRPLERLAELYVQQGVMSEARPLYLQLAEAHLRASRHPQAVGLLQKLLEVEPDNLRVQTRLADLYQAIGKQKEAVAVYLSMAQRLLNRKDHVEAEKFADRVLKVEPGHAGARLLKARGLAAAGKRAEAAALLESLHNTEANPEASALLTEQYLDGGEPSRAAAVARKVFARDPKSHALAYKVATALLDAGELNEGLALVGELREAMMEAGELERLAQALNAAAQRLPGRLEPLEWLGELYARANDSSRLMATLSKLGEAAEEAGQLEQAKEAYEQLVERNPEDEAARQCLDRVRSSMGLEPLPEPSGVQARGVAQPVAELAPQSPPVPVAAEPALDEETQRYITQALTDVDLFSSYGLTQKAVALLETVLQRAPSHAVALEKLLDFSLGASDDRRTAELAAQLEQIYIERADKETAERFAELRRRFQRAAGLTAEELTVQEPQQAPAEFAVPTVAAQPVPEVGAVPTMGAQAVPAGEAAVHEIDLSEEWAALARQLEEPPQPEASASAPIGQPGVVELHAEAAPSRPVPEAPGDAVPEYALELVPTSPEVVTETSPAEFTGPPATPMSSEQFLAELTREFESLLPSLSTPEEAAPAPTPTPSASAVPGPAVPSGPASEEVSAAPAPEGTEPLREVFEEFRAELGEMGSEEEDLETHYNLGIAYREMGLLEEAIGEFQKVAKANAKGRAFRYAMQCCTLLGLAFVEKGQPGIGAMWFERALATPGLDQETILALRYDLGLAQQMAGEEAAALKSFSQVYAMNIDYRDVAERLAALGKHR